MVYKRVQIMCKIREKINFIEVFETAIGRIMIIVWDSVVDFACEANEEIVTEQSSR